MSLSVRTARRLTSAALCLVLALVVTTRSTAVEIAPEPRAALKPVELDKAIINEVKANSELMKNLQYLSDIIGARLTGSKNLERANNWTAEKMKSYGLENVRLEPWEVPIGWQRGKAAMKILEPDTGRELMIASAGWTPGTHGKVSGPVIILKSGNKEELQKYKGKLKDAVILTRPPTRVAPVTDLNYLGGPPAKKDGLGKEEPKQDNVKKDDEKKGEAKKDDARKGEEKKGDRGEGRGDGQPPRRPGGLQFGLGVDTEFLKAEGAACMVSDAGKPHGLLVTTGGWPADRAAAEARLPRVFMAHEHYALLYRLASREGVETLVETEIENAFVPGPLTVYNTVGEVRGSEKPDEIVVVGAHLDSWDLAQGTTDNGTGSCVVLETARVIAALAKQGQRPKRTIRFCLFTGEEQGLHGSRKYVERHKDELDKHSAALVHDTGTGKVYGLGMQERKSCLTVLEPELATLAELDGWTGLTLRRMGGTDHLPFNTAGVPGFACMQENDEYRLTHHTQSDTFDKAKEPNLIQGAQVMAVAAMRIANLPDLLPRN
jgi:carboxypeptidase Q